MKKIAFILGIVSLLAGCSYETSDNLAAERQQSAQVGEIYSSEQREDEGLYIKDDMKEVVKEINALRDKYKSAESDEFGGSMYLNIYEDDIEAMKYLSFSSDQAQDPQYFNDLVNLLDRTIAGGLKDYIQDIRDGKFAEEQVISKKIGRAIVYAEYGGEFIDIRLNLLDIKNEKYREVFDTISKDQYVFNKVILSGNLNMIDFSNINSNDYRYHYDGLNIRYNMFFKGDEFRKVNILVQGEKGKELEYEDVGVFINLVNTLDIKSQGEKDRLVDEYKNLLKAKPGSKNIPLENYDLLIKSGKGGSYTGGNREMVYFSIESN